MEMKEQDLRLIEGIDCWSHNYWLYTTDGDEVARFKTIAHHTKPGICTSFQFAISINFAHKNNTAFRVKMDLTFNLNIGRYLNWLSCGIFWMCSRVNIIWPEIGNQQFLPRVRSLAFSLFCPSISLIYHYVLYSCSLRSSI